MNTTSILNTQKPDRNINKIKNTYHITKKTRHQNKTHHKTHDKNQARYIRDKLEQHQYNLTPRQIREYQNKYQHQKHKYQQIYTRKHKIIDYYQQTTPKLKQKQTTKEEYQKHQVQQNNRTPKIQNKPKIFATPASWKQ